MDDYSQDDEEQCVICKDPLVDKKRELFELDGCKHTFHSSCLVPYFRTGQMTCPLCRKTPDEMFNTSPKRVAYLSRYAKRKSAPSYLKKINKRLLIQKLKLELAKKELKHFKNSDMWKNAFIKRDKILQKQNIIKSKIAVLETDMSRMPIFPRVIRTTAGRRRIQRG